MSDSTPLLDTVDGSEFLHQLRSLSHYLQGFSTIPGGAGFLPATVSTHLQSFQTHHIHSFPGLTPLPLLTVEVEAAPPRSVCSLEPGLLAEKTF